MTDFENVQANLEEDVFEYPDMLRESGVTNMFGASPYICQEFDIGVREGKQLLVKWIDAFEERHPGGEMK